MSIYQQKIHFLNKSQIRFAVCCVSHTVCWLVLYGVVVLCLALYLCYKYSLVFGYYSIRCVFLLESWRLIKLWFRHKHTTRPNTRLVPMTYKWLKKRIRNLHINKQTKNRDAFLFWIIFSYSNHSSDGNGKLCLLTNCNFLLPDLLMWNVVIFPGYTSMGSAARRLLIFKIDANFCTIEPAQHRAKAERERERKIKTKQQFNLLNEFQNQNI